MKDEFAGVYHVPGSHKFLSKSHFIKKCKLLDAIQEHPVLNLLAKLLGIVLLVLFFCLVGTCCKYRTVSNQYEAIKNTGPSPNSQIVDRNTKVVDEEERPRKRSKPDPSTFGKRSAAEIDAKNKAADHEIELGELDVDFH